MLVPVRNGMPHLPAQLDALARQTYQGRWEIILSDNGSTDDSIRAVRAAGARVPLRIVNSREAVGRAGALAVAAGAGARPASCSSATRTTSSPTTGSSG